MRTTLPLKNTHHYVHLVSIVIKTYNYLLTILLVFFEEITVYNIFPLILIPIVIFFGLAVFLAGSMSEAAIGSSLADKDD